MATHPKSLTNGVVLRIIELGQILHGCHTCLMKPRIDYMNHHHVHIGSLLAFFLLNYVFNG